MTRRSLIPGPSRAALHSGPALRLVLLAGMIGFLAACDDPEMPTAKTGDAGVGPADARPLDPVSSEIEMPNFVPCPDGWRQDDDGEFPICSPWVDEHLRCPAGQMHRPGGSGCDVVGASCPSGSWPEGLPASGVIYVDPEAGGSQDGSLARPFDTIAEAVAAARGGDTIALAKGLHVGSTIVDKDLTLLGACATETIVSLEHDGPYFDNDYCEQLIDVQSSELTIRNVQLRDSFGVIEGSEGSAILLDGVAIYQSVEPIRGQLAGLSIRNSHVERTLLAASADCGGGASFARPTASVAGLAPAPSAAPNCEVRPSNGACLSLESRAAVEFSPVASPSMNAEMEIVGSVLLGKLVQTTPSPAVHISIAGSLLDSGAVLANSSTIDDTVCENEGLVLSADTAISDTHCDVNLRGANHSIERVIGAVSCVNSAMLTAQDVYTARERWGGLQFTAACEAMVNRAVVDHANIGLTVDLDSFVTASNLVIRDPRGVGPTNNWSKLPTAVGVYRGGQLSVDGFLLSNSAVAGARLGTDGGRLELKNGEIRANLIGVNVNKAGYDLSLLQNGVIFEDNEVNIDSQDLGPPPQVAEWDCSDEEDDDLDSLTDCEDTDCAFSPDCQL